MWLNCFIENFKFKDSKKALNTFKKKLQHVRGGRDSKRNERVIDSHMCSGSKNRGIMKELSRIASTNLSSFMSTGKDLSSYRHKSKGAKSMNKRHKYSKSRSHLKPAHEISNISSE